MSDVQIDPEDYEDIERRASDNMALLARWAEAESFAYRGGTNIKIEQGA